MGERKVTVKDLKEHLNYVQVTGDELSLEREIVVADTNRPGLELTGYYLHSQRERIVILGNKEMGYIQGMSHEAQFTSFEYLTQEETPCIIITHGAQCPDLLREIAQRKKFPVLCTHEETYRVIIDTVTFLDEKMAPMTSLHGVLVQIYGKGVLLTGESGMGKSEIALELIKKGHLLIADDRVDCFLMHQEIIGQSPPVLKEMLEIRGVGIINVSKMFGVSSVLDKTKIDLNIHLEPWQVEKDYDRVGIEKKKYKDILGVSIPKLELPVKEGRSMAAIIESAVTNYLLSSMGQDSAKEFEERILRYIEFNKNGGNES